MNIDSTSNPHSLSVLFPNSARDGAAASDARPGDRRDVAASRQHRLHEPILSSLSSKASIPISANTSTDSSLAPRLNPKLGITTHADIDQLLSTATQQVALSEVKNDQPAQAAIKQFSIPDEGSIHQMTEAEASVKAKSNLEGGNTGPPAPTSPDSLNASDPAPGTDNPTESGRIEHRQLLGRELITRTEALETPPRQPNNVPDSEQPSPNPRPGAGETAVKAPDPNDWVAQSAAMQRSLAELGQKAALDTALLKLQNDLNDATVSVMKSIGSSVKSAAQ